MDKEIIQQVKILAAQRSISISALLTEKLTQAVEQDQHYQQVKRKALHELEQGLALGGEHFDRDNLYDRQS